MSCRFPLTRVVSILLLASAGALVSGCSSSAPPEAAPGTEEAAAAILGSWVAEDLFDCSPSHSGYDHLTVEEGLAGSASVYFEYWNGSFDECAVAEFDVEVDAGGYEVAAEDYVIEFTCVSEDATALTCDDLYVTLVCGLHDDELSCYHLYEDALSERELDWIRLDEADQAAPGEGVSE